MMIEESLYEFSKRGRPKKNKDPLEKMRDINAPDSWNDLEDEDEEVVDNIDVDTSDMADAEEIEIDEDKFNDELLKTLNNELKMLEPDRRVVKFRTKTDTSKIIYGIPMAKFGNDAFLFKLKDGSIKKVLLSNIILEHQKRKTNGIINL